MAYQVANDSIVQVILRGRMGAQECMNVMHFRPVDPPAGDIADGLNNLTEIVGILDPIGAGWSHLVSLYASDQFTMDYLQAQYIWPTRFSYARFAANTTGGTVVGDPAPPNVQAAVTLQGDGVGRHQRGGMRLAGLVASDVTSGLLDAGLVSKINDLVEFLIEPFTPTTSALEYEAVIFQREAPGASVPVTHFHTQSTSRVERRRTVGLGT